MKVLITGASRGIGRAAAVEFGKKNCEVFLIARSSDRLDETAELVRAAGGKAWSSPADMSVYEEIKESFDRAENEMNGIDCALLNAARGGKDRFADYESETLEKIFELNVFSISRGIEILVPKMRDRGGIIAGVGSLADARGFPGNSAYCASKAAVSHLLEAARIELTPLGIKVITIKPGFVRTKMTAGNEFNMPFLMEPEKAGKTIVKKILTGKKRISFPPITALASYLGKIAPGFIFEPILSRGQKNL